MWKFYLSLLNKNLLIFLILILLTPCVEGVGTLQKKSYLELKSGEIAELNVLFWSSEPTEVELREKFAPKEWIVIIEPNKFILDKNITSPEVVSLGNEYVKALPVKIFVIPPKDAKPGIYEIILNMIAGRREKGISFYQEKNFYFKVNISTQIRSEEMEEEREIKSGESISKPSILGNFTIPIEEIEKIEITRLAFFATVIILFLIISWVVYRL